MFEDYLTEDEEDFFDFLFLDVFEYLVLWWFLVYII